LAQQKTTPDMPSGDPLGNPIWTALHSGHAHLAQGDATLAWYPEDVGPFAAVPFAGCVPSADALRDLRNRTEAIHFIGPRPTLPDEVEVAHSSVLQMTCDRLAPAADVEPIVLRVLTEADVPAMLELMGRVYPGYFRRRTHVLGRYLGVHHGAKLVAMGGERFLLDTHCELSGIATDPSALGRGYARGIMRRLITSMLERSISPFLHVLTTNTRAIEVYRALAFTTRAELPVLTVRGPEG
jgi:GNAT superfamily N-acetyltransferase